MEELRVMEFDIEKCQYFDDMPTPFCAIEVDNEQPEWRGTRIYR